MSTNGNPNTDQTQTKKADDTPKTETAQTCPRKFWKRARNLLGIKDSNPKPQTLPPPKVDSSQRLIELIKGDLKEMRREAKDLSSYNNRLNDDLKTLQSVFLEIKGGEEETLKKNEEETLKKFRNELMKVKLTIPSNIGAHKSKPLKSQFIKERISEEKPNKIPRLHNSTLFKASMEFKDFEDRYNGIGDDKLKLCLLCLSIFPQGAVIKKRLMLQWWVVEGFASDEGAAEVYLKELMDRGFLIEAAPGDNSCRLHPFHRSVLVELAKRAKVFNFGKEGNPTQSFEETFQACLSGSGLISYEDFKKMHEDSKYKDGKKEDPIKVVNALTKKLENLHLLMNVDEHILEFIDDWFGRMKNLNILYLGRWKALMAHHIEVEDPKFFEKLGSLKYVKFLSLQGVSNIIELHKSILELTNLEVLDLRACANLERIPDRIEKLKKLKQLDMSECFLLEHMPKGLARLTNLKVLKGFFVTNPKDEYKTDCTIKDLQKLEFLEKLCIYTDWEHFPDEKKHVAEMEKLEALEKLTITWGVGTDTDKNKATAGVATNTAGGDDKNKATAGVDTNTAGGDDKNKATAGVATNTAGGDDKNKAKAAIVGSPTLPPNLVKLDLKCFPKEETPNWLMVKNLKKLKTLYIRGGNFCDLGQYQGIDSGETEKWTEVERLRLKYLGFIEMEWRQLQGLFPNLKYLEKVRCPNLTLFPCNAKGVWNKKVDKESSADGQKKEADARPKPKKDGQKERSQRWPCCQDRVCC